MSTFDAPTVLPPQALAISLCSGLDDLEALEQQGAFVGVVLAAGIVAQLDGAGGDGGVGQREGVVDEREHAVLALCRRDRVQHLELDSFVEEIRAGEFARGEGEGLAGEGWLVRG